MKKGVIATPSLCLDKSKVVPTFTHLLRRAGCGGLAFCDDLRGRINVAFVCSSSRNYRTLRRSLDRELVLLRKSGLASTRRRRR